MYWCIFQIRYIYYCHHYLPMSLEVNISTLNLLNCQCNWRTTNLHYNLKNSSHFKLFYLWLYAWFLLKLFLWTHLDIVLLIWLSKEINNLYSFDGNNLCGNKQTLFSKNCEIWKQSNFFIFLLSKHNEKVSRINLNTQYIKISISYGLLVHSLKTFINKTEFSSVLDKYTRRNCRIMLGCQATTALLFLVCDQSDSFNKLPNILGENFTQFDFRGKIIVTFGNTITLSFSKDKRRCSFDQRHVLIHYSLHGANEKAIINLPQDCNTHTINCSN